MVILFLADLIQIDVTLETLPAVVELLFLDYIQRIIVV